MCVCVFLLAAYTHINVIYIYCYLLHCMFDQFPPSSSPHVSGLRASLLTSVRVGGGGIGGFGVGVPAARRAAPEFASAIVDIGRSGGPCNPKF